jgi:enamine deaminase RidA (YjgF/YER057c/UK114 family)
MDNPAADQFEQVLHTFDHLLKEVAKVTELGPERIPMMRKVLSVKNDFIEAHLNRLPQE